MTQILKAGSLLAALALITPLGAQTPGWSVGAGLARPTDPIFSDAVSAGVVVDGAYTWMAESAGLPLRASLGVAWLPASGYHGIPGTDPNQYKIGITGFQAALDGYAKLPWEKVRLFFGLSLDKWQRTADSRVLVVDDPDAGTSHVASGRVSGAVAGIKLGLRLGVEVPMTQRLTFQAMFQATSLGTTSEFMTQQDPNFQEGMGNNGVNPCWLQVGARWHF
jgi:hypothetical protein